MENLEGVSPRSDSVDSFDSEEHSEFEEDTIEFLNHELGLLMQYNPDLLVPDSNAIDLCPSLTPPPSFFDKHLDSQLSLKRIKVIPLATYVAEAVIHTSEYLKDNDITTPLHDSRDLFPTRGFRKAREASLRPPIDADALARIYQTTTSLYASVVSSTLLLHPNSPNWSTLLTWKCIEGPSNSTQYLPWTEAYALQIVQKKLESSDVLDTMDEGIREKLQRRLHQPPGLAFWQIFAISDKAQQLLRDLGSDTDSFRYQTCRTDGYSAPPVTVARPFDANLTSWGADVASMSSRTVSKGPAMGVDLHVPPPPRRSGRSRKSKDASTENRTALRGKAAPTKPSITVPTHREVEPSMAEKFLHRAWAKSVENDTTYMVFSCGNYERIGFRHRSSQTLFLSDMIDVPRCKDPAYGKIHVGLYLSILQDAIERSELGKEQAPAPEKKSHKRQRGDTTSASTKRPRTRSAVIKEKSVAEEERKLHQIAKGELAKCPLLLLQIRHGIYNSPTPASFQRVNSIRRSTPYGPDEYFSIVVTSKLASGATGTVHRAYLEFLPPDGEERRLDVVLKLSFEAEQVKRLRHEFAVYEHLAMRGVTQGIPVVYGLFEGPDTDAVALVMSHVGNALVKLTRDPQYDKVLSDTARDGFLRVVQTIHAAGVRHRDIRPENLTVLADDQVSVIDFDMAELHPSEGAKRRELRHLEELLEGRYYPPNLIPSADTTPERPGPGIRRAAPESGLDFVEEELGD